MFDLHTWAKKRLTATTSTIKAHGAKVKLQGLPDERTADSVLDLITDQPVDELSVTLPPFDANEHASVGSKGIASRDAVAELFLGIMDDDASSKTKTKTKRPAIDHAMNTPVGNGKPA